MKLTSYKSLLDAFRMEAIRMRRRDECKHFLVVGDTGAGKGMILRQMLHYVRSIGDVAFLHDPKRKYVEEFYDPQRGDTILDPTDERCAYWDLPGEFDNEVEAMAVFRSLYPIDANQANEKWFKDHAARVSAFISSTYRLNCTQIGRMLANPEDLHRMVMGTEHDQTLNKNAAPQLAAILGTMNTIGQAFRMMPPPSDRVFRKVFTIREWVKKRHGWLFLPSQGNTRDTVAPLQGGWADMVLMNILSTPKSSTRIWVFLDELDALPTLTKLSEGMAMARESDNPIVIAIQNMSQLDDRYGKKADTILSQAFSTFIMATKHPSSSKWLSDLIGQVELRSWRSTRTTGIIGGRERDSFSGPEETMKPLVMPEEVRGLPDCVGYFVQRPTNKKQIGMNVVRIHVPILEFQSRCRDYVPRSMPVIKRNPLPLGPEEWESPEITTQLDDSPEPQGFSLN